MEAVEEPMDYIQSDYEGVRQVYGLEDWGR